MYVLVHSSSTVSSKSLSAFPFAHMGYGLNDSSLFSVSSNVHSC